MNVVTLLAIYSIICLVMMTLKMISIKVEKGRPLLFQLPQSDAGDLKMTPVLKRHRSPRPPLISGTRRTGSCSTCVRYCTQYSPQFIWSLRYKDLLDWIGRTKPEFRNIYRTNFEIFSGASYFALKKSVFHVVKQYLFTVFSKKIRWNGTDFV